MHLKFLVFGLACGLILLPESSAKRSRRSAPEGGVDAATAAPGTLPPLATKPPAEATAGGVPQSTPGSIPKAAEETAAPKATQEPAAEPAAPKPAQEQPAQGALPTPPRTTAEPAPQTTPQPISKGVEAPSPKPALQPAPELPAQPGPRSDSRAFGDESGEQGGNQLPPDEAAPKEAAEPSTPIESSASSADKPIESPASSADDYADPTPDPFEKNSKWSNFVHRVDAISASLKELANSLPGLLSTPASPDSLLPFAKEFAKTFSTLNDFFKPIHDELKSGAAYTVINPAVGLTDLKKLNEWARGPPSGKLDQARLKWIEVNGFAVTVHHIFDRLSPEITKWGLTESEDSISIPYPSWFQNISGYEGGDKDTFELLQLEKLADTINHEIDAEGPQGHLIRSLEKILRKKKTAWDPDSDYNAFCYGNNEFGIIHDTFDLLTDAALYLSAADMKHAILKATHLVFKEWEAQTGGGEDGDASRAAQPSDLKPKLEEIFAELKVRIDRKIRIAGIIDNPDSIIPGHTTFKCDKPPKEAGAEGGAPKPSEGATPPAFGSEGDVEKPPTIPPGGRLPDSAVSSQWGKPTGEPASPKAKDPNDAPILDSQSGPDLPGYIDHRKGDFEYAAFTKAFTGYLEAETVLNPDGSCKSTCPEFRRPTPTCENKTIDCNASRNAYCEPGVDCLEKSQCNGSARKCIRTSHQVKYCPSKKPNRLYEWIDINGTLIGKESEDGPSTCDEAARKVTERWEMDFGVILNAPQYCEVCLCVCDTPMSEDGVHWFDIQPVEAEEGHVITAIKFVQKDNVIRLDAEQGKLLENGDVDQDSLKWIPSPAPDKTDATKSVQLAGKINGFRKIGLDMVYGTTKEVITGLKFVLQGETLHLSAKTTEVTTNGTFAPGGKSEWQASNYPAPVETKRKVDLTDKINPSKQEGPSQPRETPENKKVIEFDASSLLKDGGQTVIPYFDIQPTRHHTVRKALNAIGLLYKTKKGYGGFIAPTITPWRKFFL